MRPAEAPIDPSLCADDLDGGYRLDGSASSFTVLANTLRQVIALEEAKHRRFLEHFRRYQPGTVAFNLDFVEERIGHLREVAAMVHALDLGGHEAMVKQLAARSHPPPLRASG